MEIMTLMLCAPLKFFGESKFIKMKDELGQLSREFRSMGPLDKTNKGFEFARCSEKTEI
jgi:hypothetical protein